MTTGRINQVAILNFRGCLFQRVLRRAGADFFWMRKETSTKTSTAPKIGKSYFFVKE
jgi:hypothetical protein